MLATLPEEIWWALTQAQRRGVAVHTLREFVDSGEIPRKHKKTRRGKARARTYTMRKRKRKPARAPVSAALTQARLGHRAMVALSHLLPMHWTVLEQCHDLVPSQRMVNGILALSAKERATLRMLAHILGPEATVTTLEKTTNDQWRALWAAWNGSAADWNHLRRALSAALTCAFGHSDDHARKYLMKRMKLQDEEARGSNVDYETFEQILTFVPPLYRSAFRTLV